MLMVSNHHQSRASSDNRICNIEQTKRGVAYVGFVILNRGREELGFTTDGAFSIDSRLDPLRVVGSVCWVEALYNLQPALKGWSDEGAPVGSLMPKSVSFLLKGKNSTIDDIMIVLLSLLDSDTISLPLGDEFPFPYHGPTVKG